MSDAQTRSLNPLVAILLSIFGPGLGYAYVGRIRSGIAVVVAVLVLLFGAGWSRAILQPFGLYLAAAIGVLITLFPLIHSAVIAAQSSEVKTHAYNRWWVYAIWIITSSVFSEVYAASRSTLIGYTTYRVPSASMAPTLIRGDYVVADTWAFDEVPPSFGDLVVFRLPQNPRIVYAKRIVGLPGDTVEIRNDVLLRNGRFVDEPYIQLTGTRATNLSEFASHIVPDGSYFVLGDNRRNSKDSRFIGPIPAENISGRVELRWFSLDGGIRWERFPDQLGSH